MRITALATILLFTFACQKTSTTTVTTTSTSSTSTTATAQPERDKTNAEKAAEAGFKARKKAEDLKADENSKVKETNDAMNP
jgi:hypothetical protein